MVYILASQAKRILAEAAGRRQGLPRDLKRPHRELHYQAVEKQPAYAIHGWIALWMLAGSRSDKASHINVIFLTSHNPVL